MLLCFMHYFLIEHPIFSLQMILMRNETRVSRWTPQVWVKPDDSCSIKYIRVSPEHVLINLFNLQNTHPTPISPTSSPCSSAHPQCKLLHLYFYTIITQCILLLLFTMQLFTHNTHCTFCSRFFLPVYFPVDADSSHFQYLL